MVMVVGVHHDGNRIQNEADSTITKSLLETAVDGSVQVWIVAEADAGGSVLAQTSTIFRRSNPGTVAEIIVGRDIDVHKLENIGEIGA